MPSGYHPEYQSVQATADGLIEADGLIQQVEEGRTYFVNASEIIRGHGDVFHEKVGALIWHALKSD